LNCCFTDIQFDSNRRRPAFSLIELMIGIVILGLGMIMVATIYPVAWNRARELSEFTNQRAVAANADALLQTVGRISRPSAGDRPVDDASGFLGDLVLDRLNTVPLSVCLLPEQYVVGGDTWVHALNAENVRVTDRAFVGEQSWLLETQGGSQSHLALLSQDLDPQLVQASFFCPQVSFVDRVFPAMASRENVDPGAANCNLRRFTGDDPRWDDELDTRRFFVGVLHKLRNRLPLTLDDPATAGVNEFLMSAENALFTTRILDVYYVTTRRPQPTNRYARQAPERGTLPDPCTLDGALKTPRPAPVDQDVLFPSPWRVQVEFPGLDSTDSKLNCRACPTGIPTEVFAPPRRLGASPEVKGMIAGMFPQGTEFVDEASGEVFRVAKVRRVGPDLEQAVLTLDREVFAGDMDIPAGDLRCDTCNSVAQVCDNTTLNCQQKSIALSVDAADVVRTVWVYPPPVSPTRPSAQVVAFEGGTPVVGIDVMTLTITP
jgi:prepilin-type N-terminal cleavage/methylation domain-containing protein